ncbi:MAG: hypothetical protein WC810_27840 [Janthinobacterium sp.]|jgi:hypothetical protein
MNNLHLNFNRYRKADIKAVFKKYHLESILWELWQLKDVLNPIQKAYTTTVAIEFSEPGQYDSTIIRIEKNDLMNLVDLATSFCLKNGEAGRDFSNQTHDIFYYIFNLIANQFSVSYDSYGDFARAILLYKIIPCEVVTEKPEYFLPDLFEKEKGYSIDDYLKVCFIAFAAIEANGKFADDYFIEASTLPRTPDFKTMNSILSDISASAVHYRRERKNTNSLGSFRYQPLLMYPLIKPWSHISKDQRGKRYLSPLPHLIGHKAHIGIYHHFLSRYKTEFTSYFGKEIFERYVKKALISCCHGDELKDEETIKKEYKIPNGVSIPDFLLIKGDTGVIVECKAAVLPLGIYIRGLIDDFRTTVNKVYTGVCQAANFEEFALGSSLYNVSDWMRVVVTYEPLWGMNTTIFSDILITDFKKNEDAVKFKEYFDDTLILSVSQLDIIQPHITENDSIFSILKRIKRNSFNDEVKALANKTGRSFKDSHLAKYFDQMTQGFG